MSCGATCSAPMVGGGCGCGMPMRGGGCGCNAASKLPVLGGYRMTRRDRKYLRRWKKGKSIGFTMRASLKAKGLIPRANGTKRKSRKYRG